MIGSTLHQYKILEKLGSGGQGTVYKVKDTKLDRTAVVKVLPPELTAKTANFKRFEREAQLCSQLDHTNICTIYDFNESDGLFYIAMQYVEGKNVRQLVAGRPLDLQSALSIQIQVCDALAYAHKQNIIHRDVKAGNIMVTANGQVKILDFGLAKLMEEENIVSNAKEQQDLTELGIPYGTATYAAPEQAKGERADHRADIFSAGVLLYEMLTGIWAFQGKTVVEVRYQVLHGTPKPLADMRKEPFPPQLQLILDKALAKEPKDRYQKISEMRDDLRKILQEVTGVQMFETDTFAPKHANSGNPVKRAWDWIRGKNSTDSPSQFSSQRSSSISQQPSFPTQSPDISLTATGSEKKTIAILPFKNLSNDSASAFLEFALADAVITELAQLRRLIVRPSSIIAKYQGKDISPEEAGRELKVNAVLSASFLRAGDKIRVTAQLLDVITEEILWSDRIDAEGNDILTIQDEIGQRILDGLSVELSDKEQENLSRRPTDNIEAYEEFLRGRDHFGRFIFKTVSNDDCEAAIACFKKAIELDSHFALAHSGLGACYANRVFKGMGNAEDYTYAESAFSKAFKYDPNVVEARVLTVLIYLSRGEKKKARAEIKTLQAQFPNEAPIYFVKGTMHRLDGEYEESLKSWQRLSTFDPAAVVVSSYNRARIFMYQGLYDKAEEELDKGAAIEPNHPLIRIFRAFVKYYRGEIDLATAIISDVLEKNSKMDGIRPIHAVFLASQGKFDEAELLLTTETKALAKADHDMAYWVAQAHSLLGKKDEAFEWLERAIRLGNENYPWFENDSCLAPIRSDERFADLISRYKSRNL
ncbi:MAG: protein kinase [Pyrinomonadaceae bacterium]|nr:protein kinase [Pyrinomonadaceae bacterium]